DELQKQQGSLRWPKETLNKPPNEELEKEKTAQGNLKRSVEEEAARRLQEAHEEICRLTKKLDTKEKEHDKLELALEPAQLEIEALKGNLSRLKESESTDLPETKQHNHRLDTETLAVRNHVQKDSERKMCVELISSLETELSKIQEGKRDTVMKSQGTVTKAEDFQ
uniref:Uncharacterized protein n=1 Tax=Vombatus ursinus TaxID=29139 RepID=A0A4X2LKL5_VOMUR